MTAEGAPNPDHLSSTVSRALFGLGRHEERRKLQWTTLNVVDSVIEGRVSFDKENGGTNLLGCRSQLRPGQALSALTRQLTS
jgi:hypothetical protein